jgi:hypothetical protein
VVQAGCDDFAGKGLSAALADPPARATKAAVTSESSFTANACWWASARTKHMITPPIRWDLQRLQFNKYPAEWERYFASSESQ